MPTFSSAEEQAAWSLAETLSEKGFACMREAEAASEKFRAGRAQTRRTFQARGFSEIDADIRWMGTNQAKEALADNGWCLSQAAMYHQAATAQYAKALYLRKD